VSDDQPTEADAAPHRAVARVFARTASPAHLRDRAQITALFAGRELLGPGLVDATAWCPDQPDPQPRCGYYAGLARTPHGS
jgi:hypothetical protein